MRGPKLAEVLRKRYPRLRVLLISANPAFLREEEVGAGREPLLKKPFSKEDLADSLSDLLGADYVVAWR